MRRIFTVQNRVAVVGFFGKHFHETFLKMFYSVPGNGGGDPFCKRWCAKSL